MFKKAIISFIAVLLISAIAFAGNNKYSAKSVKFDGYNDAPVTTNYLITSTQTPTVLGPGDSIGFTRYDYQTNGGPLRNIVNFGDGTLAVGRMGSFAPGGSYSDRGTFYTYFDKTKWSAYKRVETARRGWGSIDAFKEGAGAGIEIVVSHVGPVINLDNAKGAGQWTQTVLSGAGYKPAQWTRHATGKEANLYIIGSPSTPDGFTPYFIKSEDAGSTFDTTKQVIWKSSVTGTADGYDIATFISGATEKIGVVKFSSNRKVYVAESTNGGTSWTETLVYNTKSDSGSLLRGQSETQPDGAGSIGYDKNGNIHVVWSNYEARGDSLNRPQLFYSLRNDILHWSAATGVNIVARPKNDSTIMKKAKAFMPGVDGALITAPDLGFDASGKPYVVYFGASSDIPDDSLAYAHVYATYSNDAGKTWKVSTDLTPVTGSDNSFPAMADLVDSHLHIVYNTDPFQGNGLQASHPDTNVTVKYLKFPVASLLTANLTSVQDGVGSPDKYSLDQNYPNPFNPSTHITFSLSSASNVSLKVYNLLGQEVSTLASGLYGAGTHVVTFNGTNLASGVYFYKIQAGAFNSVKKMILTK